MATDIAVLLQRLPAFFDFSGKTVLAVGAGGGQLAEYARTMRKVFAIEHCREQTDIVIPMTYTLALIRGPVI